MIKIGILDYGAGNLFSLLCSLRREGSSPKIISSLSSKNSFDGIILPGVGNFRLASTVTNKYRKRLKDIIEQGTPILAICLGMQLLHEKSEEASGRGLSYFKGNVVRLPTTVKVPHIGWNNLSIIKYSKLLDCVENGSWMYYVHSYYTKPKSRHIVKAQTDYGVTFPAVVENDNIFGTQFHPEKSGKTGSIILRNFIKICSK